MKFREFPLVLGHEGVGEIVAIGDGVTERAVGDRVGLPMMQRSCGRCDFCREQHVNSFVTAANCAAPTELLPAAPMPVNITVCPPPAPDAR